MPHTDPPVIALAMPDGAQRRYLKDNLEADGYQPVTTDLELGIHALRGVNAAVVLVDCSSSCRALALALIDRIRHASPSTDRVRPDLPVITLGPGDELESLRAFDAGADDYVAVPFSYPELRARIAANCRRSNAAPRPWALQVGALSIDISARRARIDGHELQLSRLEFDLLHTLATEPTRVFTKRELAREVWGHSHLQSSRTLDSHACRLRRKLCVNGHRAISNVWGVGYRYSDA